jgi:fimbrial chaperone protein
MGSLLIVMRRLAMAAAVGVATALPALAAAPVAVTPTLVTLGQAKETELVTLTNQSDDAVRFQLTVEAWDQLPNGETALKPTENVLVFPPLVSLGPREARKVRVAASTPATGAAELSYRLSVQELPASRPGGGQGQVTMLTKLSLPVFVLPGAVRAEPHLDHPTLSGGTLSFTVSNSGSGHFTVQQVKLAGDDGVARQTIELTTPGWYILAGGHRDYQAVLAAADCRKTAHLSIDVTVDDKTLHTTIPVTAANCGAAAASRFVALGGAAGSGTP